ncbi:hypothetical protein DAPPUDRAFT_121124, partial [Daphnia pulex]
MTPPPSFFKKLSKSFKSSFSRKHPEGATGASNLPPLEITQEFEDQQLGINPTTNSNWELVGARPKTTASQPTPHTHSGRDCGAYLYLAELAQQLKEYDPSQEAERRALLAKNETLISEAENTLVNSFNSQNFFLHYGNLPIIDVPQDELLFEIKHHLLLNHRELLNDSELTDAVRALLITRPELDTPVKLFRYLELQTNYSPLLSPTDQQPLLENTTPSTFHPIPSCSTGNKTAVPLTINESPIEKNPSFCPFSPPGTHVSPCGTTTEKNTSFCPFFPPATHAVPSDTTTERDTPFCPFSPPQVPQTHVPPCEPTTEENIPSHQWPTPSIPTPPTREALSVDTTLGDPIRQTVPELETTPTGILPITKTEQTSKANRK